MSRPIKRAEVTFTAYLINEGSWGANALGPHQSTMELYDHDSAGATGFIEWDIPGLEPPTEHIGLWYETTHGGVRRLVDYDGVHSLPKEAATLVRSVGIVVDKEFE